MAIQHDPTPGDVDVVAAIEADHRRAEDLLHRVRTGAASEATAAELVHALSRHASAEETIVYPEVRRAVPDGERLVDHSLDEHQRMKELLVRFDRGSQADDDRAEVVDALASAVREHVAEEEARVLPALSDALGAPRLRDLGSAFERARGAAPTRPHPHAPNQGPGATIAAPIAAVVDRVRDAVEHDD